MLDDRFKTDDQFQNTLRIAFAIASTHLSPVNYNYVLDLINAVADSFIDALGMS